MDKDTKKELENLAIMIKKGFDQTATKSDLEEVKQDLKTVKQDLEEKIDEVSANLQDQKQVPLVKKVDEKLDRELEIHGKNKTLSAEDIKEIKKLSPFPAKPVITP